MASTLSAFGIAFQAWSSWDDAAISLRAPTVQLDSFVSLKQLRPWFEVETFIDKEIMLAKDGGDSVR